MSNVFEKVGHGIKVAAVDTVKGVEVAGKAVEHALADVTTYIPRLIVAAGDVEQTAKKIIPEIATIVGDVNDIVVTGGKDGVTFLASTKALWAAVLAAFATKGTSITLDLAVIPQVQAALSELKSFENEMALLEKLYADFVPLYATIQAGIAQIEQDLKLAPVTE